jgi:putative ABC transport system permease protein
MNGLLQDLRCAVRQLRKSPAFTAVAVITLALGIGANTAIFVLLDQVLLRSLPVKDPERLVLLRFTGADRGHVSSRTDEALYFSYPMYRDLRDRNSVFSGLIATDQAQVGVQWHNEPGLVYAELVSGNYFDVLGVLPAIGRLFVASDDVVPEANPVVVLSFAYWQRRFGADRGIVGQTISINGRPFTVVGVAQRGFHSAVMGDTPGVFVPMMMKAEIMPGMNDLEDRRSRWLNIVGRLKPGLSAAQAEAGINPLWYAIRADELKLMGTSSERFRDAFLTKSHLSVLDGAKGMSPMRKDIETPLTIVMAMVGLVVLMACANVGSLLLVRAAGRIREMSIRYALGAKRSRIARQLLGEGLLLAGIGGLLGILLASQASRFLVHMLWPGANGELPLSSHLDGRILVFNFLLATLTSLLFSLAPAVQFWRPDVSHALKQQLATASGTLRFRRATVGVQIGLSLLLLVGAGLFGRTLRNLKTLDVGFVTDHLVTFTFDPTLAGYEPSQRAALDARVLQTLDAIPGVRSVAATTDPELADDNTGHNITIAGYKEKEDEDMDVEVARVSSGYFSAMGMTLLAGREINDQDRDGTPKVAVVNESFARHFFGSAPLALGHYFGNGGGNSVKTDIEIVGVVKDAKHTKVRAGILLTTFRPYLQELGDNRRMAFYIRTTQAPEAAEASIRSAMQVLDSKLVLDDFRTMQEQIDNDLNTERVVATLASSFALLAVFMAAVGLYGVLAYATAQRTREIGVRIALGAGRASVMRMVLTEVLWLAGISTAIALPASLLLTRSIRSQLFGISSSDPLTLGLMTLLVIMVALFSAMIPARRAAKVDPMVALRYE